ncbi:hypothetical protein [uncultured Sphingobacterium sp.]|uniref:hypothetical protein n=1 Tax=uncultured Sphingobacterium sp. TaxID=182688 RepID=UPI0037481EDD
MAGVSWAPEAIQCLPSDDAVKGNFNTDQASVHLAIAWRTTDGWYPMGKVDVL